MFVLKSVFSSVSKQSPLCVLVKTVSVVQFSVFCLDFTCIFPQICYGIILASVVILLWRVFEGWR